MKYPEKQLKVLENVVKQISVHFDITSVHPCSLHFIVYQQLEENGQKHNHFYCAAVGTLKRYGNLTEEEKLTSEKLIQDKFDFKLYPDGCNDSHIETAVKSVLKSLNIK